MTDRGDTPTIDRAGTIEAIKLHESYLRDHGLVRAAVFRAALHEARYNGDTPGVILQVDSTVPLSAYGYYAIERHIEDWVGWRIPILDIDLIRPDARDAVLADAEFLF